MAKPASREELVDYCKRQLGAPVLEINVSDEQVDDLVDDAFQYFQERHFDGIERMYLKYQFTQGDIDRGKAQGTTGVGRIAFGAEVSESSSVLTNSTHATIEAGGVFIKDAAGLSAVISHDGSLRQLD